MLEPIENISSKRFFDSKNGSNPLFAMYTVTTLEKKRNLVPIFGNFFFKVGSYYEQTVSGNQYSYVLATLYRSFWRDKFYLALSILRKFIFCFSSFFALLLPYVSRF